MRGQVTLEDFDVIENSEGLAQIELKTIHESALETIQLNTANIEELRSSGLFTDLQSQDIINHRREYGSFICIEEFQQLSSFTKAEIQALSSHLIIKPLIKDLNFKLNHSRISYRHSRVLERSKAYKQNSYEGSPDYMLIKYQAKKYGAYDIGVHLEKDAGETLISNKSPYPLLDHNRFYIDFYKGLGPISQFTIGDFVVNQGQGLLSSSQFRMGSATSISHLISSKNSINKFSGLDENRFLRGVAIKLNLSKAINISSFLSRKSHDAILIADESTQEETVSSLQLNGYHRTDTELSRKNNVTATTLGSTVKVSLRNFRIGINQQRHKFDSPVILNDNAFRPAGLTQHTTLYSCDVKLSHSNVSMYGEMAINQNFKHAMIAGLIAGIDPGFEIAISFRDYSPYYYSFYSGARSQTGTPQNESGINMEINYSHNKHWSLFIHFDKWLQKKSRIGLIGNTISSENLIKLKYSKRKFINVSFSFRYRDGVKAIKYKLTKSESYYRRIWRLHLRFMPLDNFELRSRIEINTFTFQSQSENGVLSYQEIVYKGLRHKIKTRFRLTLFETTSHESRIYAYEQTVPGYYAIPSYSGSGYKVQLIIGLKLAKNLSIDFGYSRISYYDRIEIGSGLDKIAGSEKTQLQSQLAYSF